MRVSRSIMSPDDLGSHGVIAILDRATHFEEVDYRGQEFSGRIVSLCFFQPSTRTRLGFAAAAGRLGGTSLTLEKTKYQPGMADAESLEDTIKVISDYSDVMVMRHGSVDAMKRAARIAKVPFVNGGSGHMHHPTQALVDLHAIRQHMGQLKALRIGIAGDILTSRSGNSLLCALRWFAPAELRLMHPPERGPTPEMLKGFSREVITERDELDTVDLNVLYMAGMPPGKGANRLPQDVRKRFILKAEHISRMPRSGVVLCALPRTGDIHPSVDEDPRAAYFLQSASGLFVRMAILEYVVCS